jgi:hypothetical protein
MFFGMFFVSLVILFPRHVFGVLFDSNGSFLKAGCVPLSRSFSSFSFSFVHVSDSVTSSLSTFTDTRTTKRWKQCCFRKNNWKNPSSPFLRFSRRHWLSSPSFCPHFSQTVLQNENLLTSLIFLVFILSPMCFPSVTDNVVCSWFSLFHYHTLLFCMLECHSFISQNQRELSRDWKTSKGFLLCFLFFRGLLLFDKEKSSFFFFNHDLCPLVSSNEW